MTQWVFAKRDPAVVRRDVSWQILRLAPTHNRLFLKSRINTLDSITDQVMKRLYLESRLYFEVLDRLYWDGTRKRPRSGIMSHKPTAGDLRHRFPVRIAQIEKNYDLMSLAPDQLLELLGDEFSFGRQKSATLFDDSEVSTETSRH